jgi:hypothetical protein
MLALVVAFGPWFAPAAHAQSLLQAQYDAVGQIEVWIYDEDGFAKRVDEGGFEVPERATGTIVSQQGHVLTAAHILDDEDYALCIGAAEQIGAGRCEIYFFQKGLAARKFSLSVESARDPMLDYLILKLPDARDAIDREVWPAVRLSPKFEWGGKLYAAGYAGSSRPSNGQNRVRIIDGMNSAVSVSACTEGDGWGYSTLMLAQSEPGYSGGPVFNAAGRLTAIVLGSTCPEGLQSAPASRILPVEKITGLCERTGCRYGMPGYILPIDTDELSIWSDRVEVKNSEQFYGIELGVIARQIPPAMAACNAIGSDSQLIERVKQDALLGGELASVLYLNLYHCNPFMPLLPRDLEQVRAQVKALADRGYEPAQMMAALELLMPITASVVQATSLNEAYVPTAQEAIDAAQAYVYIDAAAKGGWPAALFMRYELCRQRFHNCIPNKADLLKAADLGQFEARRTLALAYLTGADSYSGSSVWFGFSIGVDETSALQLLRINATSPSFMLGKWPYFDPFSAFYMQYISGGGKYLGEKLISPNMNTMLTYQNYCLSGAALGSFLSRQCYLFGVLQRYNLDSSPTVKAQMVQLLRQDAVLGDDVARRAETIARWFDHNSELTQIECPLDAFFQFAEAPNDFVPDPSTAYCHTPPD